jgi:hypothetical protein
LDGALIRLVTRDGVQLSTIRRGDVLDGVLVQVEQAAALLGAALPRLGLLLALGERGRS